MWRNGLDCVKNGLKMGGIVPLEHPKRSNIFSGEPQDLFRKTHFRPKFDTVLVTNLPIFVVLGR